MASKCSRSWDVVGGKIPSLFGFAESSKGSKSSVGVVGIEYVSIIMKKEVTTPVDGTEAVAVSYGADTTKSTLNKLWCGENGWRSDYVSQFNV